MMDSMWDTFKEYFCCCCPQYEIENEEWNGNGVPDDPLDGLSYYLSACPSTPPSPVDSRLYPTHCMATLHPIIVQPPINHLGAHGLRQLTHLQRFPVSDLPLPPSNPNGPMIYVVSNGVLTSTSSRPPPRWNPTPGRAIQSQTNTRAPPGYSPNPPSRGGAETAEPPPYPEIPEVPAYPGRGDGTMSAPTLLREPTIRRRERE